MNAAIAARVCVLTMGSVKGQPDILQMCRITMSTGMLAGCKTTCSSATSLLLQMFLSWALFYRMSFATCIVCWCDTSLTVEQGRGLQRSRGRILQRSRAWPIAEQGAWPTAEQGAWPTVDQGAWPPRRTCSLLLASSRLCRCRICSDVSTGPNDVKQHDFYRMHERSLKVGVFIRRSKRSHGHIWNQFEPCSQSESSILFSAQVKTSKCWYERRPMKVTCLLSRCSWVFLSFLLVFLKQCSTAGLPPNILQMKS